jgi:hypothetical protein
MEVRAGGAGLLGEREPLGPHVAMNSSRTGRDTARRPCGGSLASGVCCVTLRTQGPTRRSSRLEGLSSVWFDIDPCADAGARP